MKNKIFLTKVASVVMISLAATSCARFDERAQAEGNFDYNNATLIDKYNYGEFDVRGQRANYDIQALTEEQSTLGLMGKDVDVRPPNQLIPVLDGILLDPDLTQTKIWFNAFKDSQNMQEQVWQLILDYLASVGATLADPDPNTLTIQTGPIKRKVEYGSLSVNTIQEEESYLLQLAIGRDNRSMSLVTHVESYEQINDGIKVEQILDGRTKRSIEIDFVNRLLEYAYKQQEAELIAAADNKPLPIKLGFDDNHQTAWVIDEEFIVAWNKLPQLLQLMSFAPVQEDKNLGYFLVRFEPQDEEYWAENNLNPITLEGGEYFVQLGELTGGATSLIWLNADKELLSQQEVTDLYLSITDNIRSVTLENDAQSAPKPL